MAVIETEYPISDVSAGDWEASTGSDLYAMLDESGSHDSDSTFVHFTSTTSGFTQSTFEVHITDPSVWTTETLQVRFGETWRDIIALSVRESEAWEPVASLYVRQGSTWELVVPEVVIRVTARNYSVSGDTECTGTIFLRDASNTIASGDLSVASSSYVEAVLRVPASSLCNVDPSDLRVRVTGFIDLDPADASAAIRVTQIKMELES